MSHPVGQDCAVAAFPTADLRGLTEAAARLASASSVVPTLVLAIDPRHWQQTRSAISGLRRQGPSIAAAAPAIAGWVALSVDRANDPDQMYAVNEALNGLAEIRAALDDRDEASARMVRFLDLTFQPFLLSTLVPPLRVWQRGAVNYLRGLHGDLLAVAASLRGLLLALQHAPEPERAEDDWFAYLRMDLVGVVADLGVRLAVSVLEEQSADDLPAAVARLLALAAEDPDPQVRAAALDALVTSGVRADLMLPLALEAAAAEHPAERTAAARLLAVLIWRAGDWHTCGVTDAADVSVRGEELASASLVELAVSRLSREILSGNSDPGDRLIEEQLTRRFGISRGPLREALRLLAQQGLVEHVPRRGVRVATLSERDIQELYTVRDVLERHAVSAALGDGAVPDLTPVRAALAAIREAVDRDDRAELTEAHRRFHVALVGLAGNRQLSIAYESVLLKIQLYMAINLRRESEHGQPQGGVQRHERLIEALATGDESVVLAALNAHGARAYLT